MSVFECLSVCWYVSVLCVSVSFSVSVYLSLCVFECVLCL